MSSDEVRSVFEQAVTGMSEYYKGTTPVGEQLYYAGGADGENAILVLVVPESSASAVFIGPATVGDDNKLTVQDETTAAPSPLPSSITATARIRSAWATNTVPP